MSCLQHHLTNRILQEPITAEALLPLPLHGELSQGLCGKMIGILKMLGRYHRTLYPISANINRFLHKPTLPVKRTDAPTCVLKCGTISKITRMASCTAFSLPCDPNATLTILGTVAVLAASSIEQSASVLVFSQQWRKLTNLTSLVISSIVLYLYLNCK